MSQTNIFMGLDIGSTKISTVICELNNKGELKLLGGGTSISAGIERGDIVDENECFRAIERSIQKAHREAGVKPTKVIANIVPFDMQFVTNTGVLMSQEETGQISLADRKECVRRSRNIVKQPFHQLVHAMPLEYRVDGSVVQNPVGVFGKHLEVDTMLILSHETIIQKLTVILRKAQLHISGLAYDGLGNGQICLSDEQRKEGTLLIDIGGQFTRANLFVEGNLSAVHIVPIGGDTFTRDVSHCLKLSIPEAERVKILHGCVDIESLNADESVDVTTQESVRKPIKKLLLGQILEARAKELMKLMQAKLLPGQRIKHIVFTGGGSQLSGLNACANQFFGQKTVFSVPKEVRSIIDNPHQQTSIGLLLYGLKTKAIDYEAAEASSVGGKVTKWIRELF